MRTIYKSLTGAAVTAAPLLAGALLLTVSNPANNPEASKMGAAVG